MLIGFVVSERYLQYHMSAFWLYIDNGPRQFRDCACAVSQCTDRQKQSKTVKQQKNDHWCTNRHMSTQSPPNTQSHAGDVPEFRGRSFAKALCPRVTRGRNIRRL